MKSSILSSTVLYNGKEVFSERSNIDDNYLHYTDFASVISLNFKVAFRLLSQNQQSGEMKQKFSATS